jgi:hypothetical protein
VVTHVVETSTVGLAAARSVDALLAGTGIAYVDRGRHVALGTVDGEGGGDVERPT